MIGDFAVGKTSLVSRYVHSQFGEKYQTTVGVKIDTKSLVLASGDELKLVLWDIAGKSDFCDIDSNYLQGASAYLLVADSTRPETLDSAISLQADVEKHIGIRPFSLLLNKSDLSDRQQLDPARIRLLDSRNWLYQQTSALSGEGVDQAFSDLGKRLLHKIS
jgi:small GTP-binding protein